MICKRRVRIALETGKQIYQKEMVSPEAENRERTWQAGSDGNYRKRFWSREKELPPMSAKSGGSRVPWRELRPGAETERRPNQGWTCRPPARISEGGYRPTGQEIWFARPRSASSGVVDISGVDSLESRPRRLGE